MDQIIRCSGVPEHFNFPWKLLIESKEFQKEGIKLEWVDNPQGTGSLCQEMKEGHIDIAILLLEGAIKNIHEGLPSKIFTTYVESPLIWGVHAASASSLSRETLIKPSFAISRPTSGSHLMAYLFAKNNGLEINESSFEIVNNLKGAIESLPKNENQLFLWEKYTTKPLVDNGIFKKIDECPTPWPAFVVVVSNELLKTSGKLVHDIISKVMEQGQIIKNNSNSAQLISKRYGIKEEDTNLWLKEVKWAKTIYNDTKMIDEVANTLLELGVLESKPSVLNLIATKEMNIVI